MNDRIEPAKQRIQFSWIHSCNGLGLKFETIGFEKLFSVILFILWNGFAKGVGLLGVELAEPKVFLLDKDEKGEHDQILKVRS